MVAFSGKAEEHLFDLIWDLRNGEYVHGQYSRFVVHDPKRREIAKAPVRDRVLHHAIHRVLAPMFDSGFIFDSYSSRSGKGTHRAVLRLKSFILKTTQNGSKTGWVLKCDIKKFFDSIDHEILFGLVREKIEDEKLLEVIEKIIRSYEKEGGKGIPLGNLTSQLFSNVYFDPFDQYVKRAQGIKHYLRYADDFVILDCNRRELEKFVLILGDYLEENLHLKFHLGKISIKKVHQGIDFLGYVVFPTHIVLRTKTKRRMLRKIQKIKIEFENKIINRKKFDSVIQSYLGILKHCRGNKIRGEIERILK